jgi:two-component system NtrC family sensor kinase
MLNSLTFRLTATLILAVIALFGLTALLQLMLQQRFGNTCGRVNALALNEGLYGALHSTMLANRRDELAQSLRKIGAHAPNLRIRIFDKEGTIAVSSTPEEVGRQLDEEHELCFGCHEQRPPKVRLGPEQRTRKLAVEGHPAVGVMKPIPNEPSCAGSQCHVPPSKQRFLGLLDTTLVLTAANHALSHTRWLMVLASVSGTLFVIVIVVLVIRREVRRPVIGLAHTMGEIGSGNYTARFEQPHTVEFNRVGLALNGMAQQLERANTELTHWAQTLERRVDEKTAELKQAQQRVIRVERMAALGKLAAVVAHEINNPLAGVLTYAKLLHRRLEKNPELAKAWGDGAQILEAIADESKRCGGIVSSLLSFARGTGSRSGSADVNHAVNRALFLLKHQLNLSRVTADLDLKVDLPRANCNEDQLQQALLALFVNALDAMPDGGTLTVRSRAVEAAKVEIEVSDTGCGIPPEVRERMLEPFYTTKAAEEGKGLGLGLTVVDSIVQENDGTLALDSEVGRGTTFTLRFPIAGVASQAAGAAKVSRSDGEGEQGV